MGAPSLLVDRDGPVAIFRLNRPATLNALDSALIGSLAAELEGAARDGSVRAMVLTGSEGSFCSGADLKEALADLDHGKALGERLAPFQAAIRSIAGAPQPVIAAVDGAAVGFGADLALACDLRLLSERAYIQEKFVGIGLMPDGGGTYHLTRLVGPGRALELLMLGEKVEAARALELGLANRVFSAASLLDETLALAHRLADGPPLALTHIKQATRLALGGTLDEALAREAAGQTRLLASADLREGVTAFAEKRKPKFRGQ